MFCVGMQDRIWIIQGQIYFLPLVINLNFVNGCEQFLEKNLCKKNYMCDSHFSGKLNNKSGNLCLNDETVKIPTKQWKLKNKKKIPEHIFLFLSRNSWYIQLEFQANLIENFPGLYQWAICMLGDNLPVEYILQYKRIKYGIVLHKIIYMKIIYFSAHSDKQIHTLFHLYSFVLKIM